METNNQQVNILKQKFGNKKRWVNWRLEKDKDGKDTKKPYQIDGINLASSTNPPTWNTYDNVIKASPNIGIVFTPDKTLLGIDIDHCLESGLIVHERKAEIEKFIAETNTYFEISPSGTGLHGFLITTTPLELLKHKVAPFELYNSGRYFTVTNIPYGEPCDVRTTTSEEVVKLLSIIGYPWVEKNLPKKVISTPTISLDDLTVLEKMFASKNGDRIRSLYNGDITQNGNDDSSADMALCSHLAFWTGQNASQMERIWLNSPLGQRTKTKGRKDYRDRTINYAIKNCKEIYSQQTKDVMTRKEDTGNYLPAMSHADLMTTEFPPVRYIIDFLCEKNAMNMISAPPNGWKSWFIFLYAGSIATGTPLFNKFNTEKTCVMIVNEEDIPFLIQDRLKLLNLTDTSLSIYYRVAQGAKMTEKFVDNLIKEAREKNIGVIMFDSLRSIHDADENSSKEMQAVLDLFKKINREQITVVFTHHHKKKSGFGRSDDAEMSRGSSAINASISGHISLEEVDKDGEKYLIVKHLKTKAGKKLSPFDIGIQISDSNISFHYSGDHKPEAKALDEAKTGILYELDRREELLGRKDFIYLKVGGTTTVRDATKFLVKEGKIKMMTRTEAKRLGLKTFSEGKGNENLYYIDKEDNDSGIPDQLQIDDTS